MTSSLMAAALAPSVTKAQTSQSRGDTALAYATAFQATVFGYPLQGMYARMSAEVLNPAIRKAPFNTFFHYRELATPTVSPFPAPNNDTLYSTAWLDLRREPAILGTPEMSGRYYTAQILDLTTETIANVGRREDGDGPGVFAIVGPGWSGDLPANVKRVIRSETSIAYVLLRILVDGPEDVPAVNALQDRFSLASLSRFRMGQTGVNEESLPPLYVAEDARQRLGVLDRVLRMSPTREVDKGMVASFAPLGIGPKDPTLRISPTDETLDRAEADARALIATVGARTGSFVNGWRMPAKAIGRYGVDYLQRASVWDGGPLANIVEESFYPAALLDDAGRPLDGASARYQLRFGPGMTPPVDAFWSLTMYKLDDKFLVANSINRYSIGNRTQGLLRGADGSLTINIQAERPTDAAAVANWLPAPRQHFYMVLRLYGPASEALSGSWAPPPVERLRQ
ncbi:MAG: DUF1254 domain-containing protein [Beijerinckiaceae bacterium]|nr:DUF1254 domain-containing protein [Beijerinckiaceae bacterium]